MRHGCRMIPRPRVVRDMTPQSFAGNPMLMGPKNLNDWLFHLPSFPLGGALTAPNLTRVLAVILQIHAAVKHDSQNSARGRARRALIWLTMGRLAQYQGRQRDRHF